MILRKKILTLGDPAVGKTSLVRRYIHQIFSDRYLSTIGVRIDKKVVEVGDDTVEMLLWDLHGARSASEVNQSYLRGATGYVLVADGTRPETIATALDLKSVVDKDGVPYVFLLNKVDLTNEWRPDPKLVAQLEGPRAAMIETSAKTGQGVEEAFRLLVDLLLEQ